MNELLALIGRYWQLVLIYPGGITAILAWAATGIAFGGALRPRPLLGSEIAIAIGLLLVITLLPLPQTGWPYPLDLAALLLLIEAPWCARLLRRSPTPIDDLARRLNVYPLLALSLAALGQAAGTLVLIDIGRSGGALHWVGLAGWAIALPPLLGIGPWRVAGSDPLANLRRVAHLGLILAAALPANDASWRLGALIGFVALLLPLALLDRWWRGQPGRWIAWQPWLSGALLVVIGVLSAGQLVDRLR